MSLPGNYFIGPYFFICKDDKVYLPFITKGKGYLYFGHHEEVVKSFINNRKLNVKDKEIAVYFKTKTKQYSDHSKVMGDIVAMKGNPKAYKLLKLDRKHNKRSMYLALDNGNLSMVKYLLKKGVNIEDEEQKSLALTVKHQLLFNYIMDNYPFAEDEMEDFYVRNALSEAIKLNAYEAIKRLKSRLEDFNFYEVYRAGDYKTFLILDDGRKHLPSLVYGYDEKYNKGRDIKQYDIILHIIRKEGVEGVDEVRNLKNKPQKLLKILKFYGGNISFVSDKEANSFTARVLLKHKLKNL